MTTDRLGAAVVGAGVMGTRHARVLHDIEGAYVNVVADVDARAAKNLASTVGARWTTEVDDAIADAGTAFVSICTPDDRHVEPAVQAARSGRDFIVEKPLATTLSGCSAIIEAVRDAGVTASVGHTCRFESRNFAAKELIARGELGDVLTISTRRIQHRDAQQRLRGRCSLPLFLGVHEYDLVRWLAGDEVVSVTAHSKRGLLTGDGYDVDDVSIAVLRLASGALALVETSWILPDGQYASYSGTQVFGSSGFISMRGSDDAITLGRELRTECVDVAFTPQHYDSAGGALGYQLRRFLVNLRKRTTPAVTLEDGRAAVDIALAVEESAVAMKTIAFGGAPSGRP